MKNYQLIYYNEFQEGFLLLFLLLGAQQIRLQVVSPKKVAQTFLNLQMLGVVAVV